MAGIALQGDPKALEYSGCYAKLRSNAFPSTVLHSTREFRKQVADISLFTFLRRQDTRQRLNEAPCYYIVVVSLAP